MANGVVIDMLELANQLGVSYSENRSIEWYLTARGDAKRNATLP
jgi:hypothetical protein